MNQWEYNTIIAVLDQGAPALAEVLSKSLENLILERNQLAKENEELKASKCDCSCETTETEAKKSTSKKAE